MSSHFAVLGDNPADSVFVKLITDSLDMEYKKAMAVYNLSLESNLFVAAEPLSICTDSNLLVLRKLPPFHTIGHWIGKYNQRINNQSDALIKLINNAGEILAELHTSIQLKSEQKPVTSDIFKNLPVENCTLNSLIKDSPIAHLHWDYGFSNVLVIDSDAQPLKLCIIDAAPNIIKGATINDKGSIYIDIGMFLSQIYLCTFPAYYYPLYKWELDYKLSQAFLAGYENRTSTKLNHYAAFSTALLISKLYTNLFYTDNSAKSIIKKAIISRGLNRLAIICEQYVQDSDSNKTTV